MQLTVPAPLYEDYDLKQAVSQNRLVGLWRVLTGYRKMYFWATFSMAMSATARTLSLLLLGLLVDQVLVQPGVAALVTEGAQVNFFANYARIIENAAPILLLVALGFVGLAMMQGGGSFMAGKLAAQAAEGMAMRLKDYLFDHIQRLRFAYHDKMPTGDLIQRCTSDVDAIRRFYAEQALEVGRIMSLFLVNTFALLLLNWQLALLSIMVIPIVIAVSVWFFRMISRRYEMTQEQESIVSTTLQENLSGVRVVKAFARQGYEIDKFERNNWKQYQLDRVLMIGHAFYWPVTDLMTGAQLLFGYFIAAVAAINGTISVGLYVAYVGMLILIIFPIRNLGRVIIEMATGSVSYSRVRAILEQDREPLGEDLTPPVTALSGSLVFDHVGFGYETNQEVLKDISFTVKPGQIIALLGSTGSGKTSLMNLLPRFYEYTSGSIRLDGVELRDYPRAFLRRQIGIVEQEPFLFSRSIRENITYGAGRQVSDEEVIAAARAAAAHEFIASFPEGYSTLVGERGVTLSGGQKQRIAIARTILKNPRILILDDATSSVDTETEAEIREALRNLMTDRTSFVIAHRIQSVMDADLIVVMDKGRIVQMGTHESLLKQDGIYRRIYDVQSRIEAELEEEISRV